MEISGEVLDRLATQMSHAKRILDELEREFMRLAAGEAGCFLYLVHVDNHGKISTIKAIREMTGLGLREAKTLTDQVQMGQKVFIKAVLTKSNPESPDMRAVEWIESVGSKVEWRSQ